MLIIIIIAEYYSQCQKSRLRQVVQLFVLLLEPALHTKPSSSQLFRDLRRARLADDGHPDLPGVLHGFFNFLGYIPRQARRGKIINRFWFDNDTDFASGLNCKSLLNSLE